jgi:diguanylate cyclase (GGDEF)-like protein
MKLKFPSVSPLAIAASMLAALWLLFALHTVGAFGGVGYSNFFDGFLYNALALSAAAACLLRAVRKRDARAGWLLLGIALLFWSAGEIVWTAILADQDVVPIPSAADALYLAFYPTAYVGLGLLVRARTAHPPRDLWLDGVIAAFAVAGLAAAFTLQPVLDAGTSDPAEVAVNLAYPIGDITLLSLVAVVFGLSRWRPGRAWALLGAGLALMAAADCVYLVQAAKGTYSEGAWLDAVWPASALMVGFSAWADETAREAPDYVERRAVVIPAACGLIALTLIGLGLFQDLGDVAGMLAMATLLMVTLRMALAFADGQRAMLLSRKQAFTDSLTGLGNRRQLMDDLTRQIPRAAPASPRVCVILDLDGFKGYNDSYGHPAGDQLLARLGGRLQGAVAPFGRAYRLGGDEFCVVARCDPPVQESVIAATRAALSETGEGFAVTASAGAVLIPAEADTPSSVLQLADRRMYAQKNGSRPSPARQSRDVLLRTLREREPELHAHLNGVAELSVEVARRLGMEGEELDEVSRAAELHDVGKIAVPEAILRKPGPLDDEEWAFMRRHTVIGERILSAAPALVPVAKLVRSSHERWDGEGYPDGLEGDQIPLGARVVAACDAYDAMTTDRPYRPAMSVADALAEMRRCAGSQFDPRVVDAFELVLARQVRGARESRREATG